MPEHDYRNICMLRLSALGDVCHALPVARAIQDHLPRTPLTWVIGALEHQLLGDIKGIDFIPFQKRDKRAVRTLRTRLGSTRFDVLLHMQVALRASLLSRHIRAHRRIGFDRARARDWQWLFTNERIAPGPQEHVMDGLLRFLEPLGIRPGTPRWDIPVPPDAAEFAADQLGGQATLVISPCTSQRARNFRNWPVERFVEVAEHARERGLQVAITGGPTSLEKEYGEGIARGLGGDCINLVGRTSLKQLFAVLQRATVLVSPDSGPVHMANAAGTPVVGLYATSNPDRTGPYHRRHLVANRYPDALEQFMGKTVDNVRWGQRVRHPDAMALISVDDVTGKLDLALQESGRAG